MSQVRLGTPGSQDVHLCVTASAADARLKRVNRLLIDKKLH